MTLALLITAVGGAWAQDTYNVTFKANGNTKTVENVTLPKTFQCSYNNADGDLDLILKELYGWTGDSSETICANWSTPKSSDANKVVAGKNGNDHYITIDNVFEGTVTITGDYIVDLELTQYSLEISIAEPTEWSLTPDETGKTWTLAKMPASDVVLTPIYAKAAAFATTGTESEVKTLLPEAAEGVIAGTDAPLIVEGTGIVAFAGTSTEVTQGTLMYAIGTSATEAPALTAFSATVPTAENVADAGDVYVWYYIKGADAPEGETATLDNTFDNTEPACLTVTVLTNKFDIQFNAANDNTIEAGKATVTVGGTAQTVTEGKLQGVKMGSEVKLKANTGYKFRKVEVKKGSALKTLTVTGVATKSINYAEGDTWQQAIERPENEGSGWRVQGNYIFNGGLTLMIGSGYVRPEHTIDATKNYSLQAD